MVITDVEAIEGPLDKQGLINLAHTTHMTEYEPAPAMSAFRMGLRGGVTWNVLYTPGCTCGGHEHTE